MASELLKTFQKIEKGRLSCVEGLKKLDYPLNEYSSFDDIGFYINNLPKHEDLIYSFGDRLTPENDPLLNLFPEDWINIREIFTACEDFEKDGKVYFPAVMSLFSTDLDTTEFIISKTTSGDVTKVVLDKGKVEIGTIPTGSSNYYVLRGLKFSDSNDIVFLDNAEQTYVHTWDKSKDIVLKDNTRLKYLITYLSVSSNSYLSHGIGYTNYTGVDLHECISWSRSGVVYAVSGTPSMTTNYLIGGGDSYKRLTIISPFTEKSKELFSSASTAGFTLGETKCKELVIDLDLDFDVEKPFAQRYFFAKGKIRSIKCNVPRLISAVSPGSGNANDLIYLQVPYIASMTGSYLPNLRYLYIDPEEQKKHTITSDVLTVPYYDTNLLDNIVSYLPTSSLGDTVVGLNNNVLTFNNLETTSSQGLLKNVSLRAVHISKLKTLTNSLFSTCAIETISLPSVESITVSNWVPRTIKYLSLPSLKDFSKISYYSTGTSSVRILYLDISSVENTSLTLSTNYSQLRWIVLPKNITMTRLDLSNADKLQLNCILDIFDKLADVTNDTTTHIIKIGDQKTFLSDEDLAIPISKGWVVE